MYPFPSSSNHISNLQTRTLNELTLKQGNLSEVCTHHPHQWWLQLQLSYHGGGASVPSCRWVWVLMYFYGVIGGRGAEALLLSFAIVLSCSHWRCHGATVITMYVSPCATGVGIKNACLINARDSSLINCCCACGLTGHPPRTQRTITVVMAAWCQCDVPWLNITFKFRPRRDVCAIVRDVWFGSQNAASHHIRLLSGGRIFYSIPVLSAGLVIIVSKDNSGRCCTCTFARALAHWHRRSKREEDSDKSRLWRLSIFVSGWQQGVLYRSAHWHHSSQEFLVAQ
jgi:hypothetical protein